MNNLPTPVQEKLFNRLLNRPENGRCADCSGASIDFGVFVCLNCSGAHRALGPSVTRVRSTKLDVWPVGLADSLELGNDVCNKYWEANPAGMKKPNANSTLDEIKRFVLEKYIKKKYAAKGQVDPVTQFKNHGAKALNTHQQPELQKNNSAPSNTSKSASIKAAVSEPVDILAFEEDIPATQPVSKPSTKELPKKAPSSSGLDLLNFNQPASEPSSAGHAEKKQTLTFHSFSPAPAAPVIPSYQNVYHNNLYSAQHPTHNLNFNSMYPAHHGHNLYQNHHHPHIMTPQANFNLMSLQPQLNGGTKMNQQQHSLLGGYTPQLQQQPVTMNMNINMNMYANSMSFNLQPSIPVTTAVDKKGDLFSGLDEFKF